MIKTAFARMPKYNELYGKFDRNLNKLLALVSRAFPQSGARRAARALGAARSVLQAEVGRCLREGAEGFQADQPDQGRVRPGGGGRFDRCARRLRREMKRLSDEAGEPLVKGASGLVLAQAKRIVETKRRGSPRLFRQTSFQDRLRGAGAWRPRPSRAGISIDERSHPRRRTGFPPPFGPRARASLERMVSLQSRTVRKLSILRIAWSRASRISSKRIL